MLSSAKDVDNDGGAAVLSVAFDISTVPRFAVLGHTKEEDNDTLGSRFFNRTRIQPSFQTTSDSLNWSPAAKMAINANASFVSRTTSESSISTGRPLPSDFCDPSRILDDYGPLYKTVLEGPDETDWNSVWPLTQNNDRRGDGGLSVLDFDSLAAKRMRKDVRQREWQYWGTIAMLILGFLVPLTLVGVGLFVWFIDACPVLPGMPIWAICSGSLGLISSMVNVMATRTSCCTRGKFSRTMVLHSVICFPSMLSFFTGALMLFYILQNGQFVQEGQDDYCMVTLVQMSAVSLIVQPFVFGALCCGFYFLTCLKVLRIGDDDLHSADKNEDVDSFLRLVRKREDQALATDTESLYLGYKDHNKT